MPRRSPLTFAMLALLALCAVPASAQVAGDEDTLYGARPEATPRQDVPITPEVQKTLDEFEAASKAAPNDATALARFGWAQCRVGRMEDGLALITRAQGMAPDDPNVLLFLSKAYVKADRAAEAADTAMKIAASALATPKQRAEALFTAGSIRWRQGSLAAAEKALREAIEIDPSNGGALLNLGLVLYAKGQRGEAVSFMDKAVERDPKNPRIAGTLARVMETMGNMPRAAALWETVTDLRPQDVNAHYAAAGLYLNMGEWAKAAAHVERAIALNPADVKARMRYTEALIELRRFDEAETQCRMIEKLGGDAANLMMAILAERQKEGAAPPAAGEKK